MTNIVVPQLGESVVEARVARWLKKEGDRVEVGDPVVELETEKIDLEVNSEKSGVLASIARKEGEDVKIGELLGTIDDGGLAKTPSESAKTPGGLAKTPSESAKTPSEAGKASPSGGNGARAAAATPAAASPSKPQTQQPPPQPAQPDLRATPTARRMAREHEVDLGGVQGSGSAGRVMKQDVQNAMTPPAAKPTAPPPPARPRGERREERARMSKRRATIARRLVEAQRTAAMLTTFNEIDMTAVMKLRERQKEPFKQRYGVGLGIASFFVKAAVVALRGFPQLNAEIQGDEIVLKHYYDIGIAVGAEGGLVVPVLRDADTKSFAEIELAIRDFATRAGNSSLTLEDLSGGTFTITNGGVFGSLLSTPILNPPQVGILGLHKVEDRVVPENGQPVIRPMMYVALSYDHRIVDGREAVQFLVKIKQLVEDPGNLLLES